MNRHIFCCRFADTLPVDQNQQSSNGSQNAELSKEGTIGKLLNNEYADTLLIDKSESNLWAVSVAVYLKNPRFYL